MAKQFEQVDWDEMLEAELRAIIEAAVAEDLGRWYDWTTVALVPAGAQGRAHIVARQPGVVAGLGAARMALLQFDRAATWTPLVADGDRVAAGTAIVAVDAAVRHLLAAERLVLNLLGRLSGIATLTRQYVDAVAGTGAHIYDTRKTTPGWRRLEKYAVRTGGGTNHRLGLSAAALVKDNHLAWGAAASRGERFSPAEAVARLRMFVAEMMPPDAASRFIIEVEIDSVEQLDELLMANPDIVLLDNMTPDELREAVARRNAQAPQVQLEASGGITLENVADIAAAGVERISVGALTHSAPWLDVSLDWQPVG